MTASDIVEDPGLRNVLDTSARARQQSMNLVDLAEANAISVSQSPSLDIQLEFSKQQKLLYSYLAELRGLNRNAINGVRNTKQVTAEARQEIDRLHLHLQNLYYEERHLRGEIAACESYEYVRLNALSQSPVFHTYQQLPLIPVEEFLEKYPEHAEKDEKSVMTARIDHEYSEREALEQERQVLLKKKQALIAENKKRKDDLASLDKDLEKFIDAAKPIQTTLEKEY
ncbi:MAG: hypothetical protein HETSPECPRED_006078 [Heterodermia speciosa]|uniref:THO complex subunit 5 n=1 Tax=Heterodermia speciosa TaxID=116794 RepID=A0A8H3EI59_9LECA|nr:MAG: hypothetical protein HETSPECPRED_006078 [Heterodermia speciosa]